MEIAKKEEPNLPALPTTMLPAITALTESLGIPRKMLASDEEIQYAWRGLPRELKEIPSELRDELIARMCVAVSTGLFDGAMNYIWNASILQLRSKIRNFGLPAVAKIQQEDFEEKHLLELQDSKLLELCRKLNLVNKEGYFFLDQCRAVRNNFSAAHPTLGTVNDREFITFLNRCVRYALADSSSPKGVDISAFTLVIKGARFNGTQCKTWIQRLLETHDEQRQMLVGMVHGIYCDPNTSEPSRLNSLDLCSGLKEHFSSAIRSDLINKHSEYSAKGDTARHNASLQFFEKLGLLMFLNETERHGVFYRSIDRLWNVHNGMNNFYNEPPFAERLLELSQQGAIPETVQESYVQTVCCCFIGSQYGFSWAAAPHYEQMIKGFSPREITAMIRLATSAENNMLGYRVSNVSLCNQRFKEALALIEPASIPSGVKTEYEKFIKKP